MMAFNDVKRPGPEDSDSWNLVLLRLERDQELKHSMNDFLVPRPGSVLQADDLALGEYSLSSLVRDLLMTSLHISSGLKELLSVLADSGRELGPLNGPYALVRAHMEASSQALWLLTPQAKKGRLMRCIRFWCAEVKLLNGFQAEWARSFAMPNEIGFSDLEALAGEAGLVLDGFPLKKKWEAVTSTEVLKTLEFAHDSPTMTWFNTWQLCSGFAHGRQWAPGIFDQAGDEGEATSNASLRILAGVVHEAGRLLDEAARRFGQLLTTTDAAWPVRVRQYE